MIKREFNGRMARRIVGALCACILGIILIAGLWPFQPPRNRVKWLKNENGLDFGPQGTAMSSNAFQPSKSASSGRLEMWLQPDEANTKGTILSFEGVERSEPFSLFQDGSAFGVRRHNIDEQGTDRIAVFVIPRALRAEKRILVDVVLAEHETSVYLDGVLAETSKILGESKDNFTGRLVLGNSASANDSWRGKILGLAFYDRFPTQIQAARSYDEWIRSREMPSEEKPLALYFFDERRGAVTRNRVNPSTDLSIPRHYVVLHPAFLSLPRNPYRFGKPSLTYWKDIIINVAGFVPLGFFFVAYFSSLQRLKWPVTVTILFGFALSLFVEISQRFLPTRDSDLTDIITNTGGTALGTWLYSSALVREKVSSLWEQGASGLWPFRTRDAVSVGSSKSVSPSDMYDGS